MTFLHKSHSEWSKIEKPVLVLIRYEGPDEDKAVEMVSSYNKNNDYVHNVNSSSERDDEAK